MTSFIFIFVFFVGMLLLPATAVGSFNSLLVVSLVVYLFLYGVTKKTIIGGTVIALAGELLMGVPIGVFSGAYVTLSMMRAAGGHFIQIPAWSQISAVLDWFTAIIMAGISFVVLRLGALAIEHFFYHADMPWAYARVLVEGVHVWIVALIWFVIGVTAGVIGEYCVQPRRW